MCIQPHSNEQSSTNSMKIINFVESYVYKKYNDRILKYIFSFDSFTSAFLLNDLELRGKAE